MLYNGQFIDSEEAPQKKSAHFLTSLSPTLYIRGAVTSPHICGCDVTGLEYLRMRRLRTGTKLRGNGTLHQHTTAYNTRSLGALLFILWINGVEEWTFEVESSQILCSLVGFTKTKY